MGRDRITAALRPSASPPQRLPPPGLDGHRRTRQCRGDCHRRAPGRLARRRRCSSAARRGSTAGPARPPPAATDPGPPSRRRAARRRGRGRRRGPSRRRSPFSRGGHAPSTCCCAGPAWRDSWPAGGAVRVRAGAGARKRAGKGGAVREIWRGGAGGLPIGGRPNQRILIRLVSTLQTQLLLRPGWGRQGRLPAKWVSEWPSAIEAGSWRLHVLRQIRSGPVTR